MVYKRGFIIAVVAATLLFGSITASAQILVGGKVIMKGEDGKAVSMEGIKISCYRTDIEGGCREVITNKNGDFTILGIPPGGSVILGVSGPGIAPTFVPDTKAGSKGADELKIEVTEGDGREPSETEVRAAAANAFSGDLTEDQKKAQAKLAKEREEIMGNNLKVEERNKLREEYMKDGVTAYEAKDFDLAVEKFTAGYELDPTFVGSAPTFLNNKAAALKNRSVTAYNEATKTKISSEITKGRQKVSRDFTAVLKASAEAHRIASTASEADVKNPADNKGNIKKSLDMIKSIFNVLGQLKMTLTESVNTTEEAAEAVAVYKSMLQLMPDDVDVLAGLTISLYYSSTFSGDESLKAESLKYSEQYFSGAKKTHSLHAAVTEIVGLIKEEG